MRPTAAIAALTALLVLSPATTFADAEPHATGGDACAWNRTSSLLALAAQALRG